ncbi:MAG: hypothetical protein K6B13_12545 [Prevotella sp.]|nr:hypothetical protein [Prevotella sp.]
MAAKVQKKRDEDKKMNYVSFVLRSTFCFFVQKAQTDFFLEKKETNFFCFALDYS